MTDPCSVGDIFKCFKEFYKEFYNQHILKFFRNISTPGNRRRVKSRLFYVKNISVDLKHQIWSVVDHASMRHFNDMWAIRSLRTDVNTDVGGASTCVANQVSPAFPGFQDFEQKLWSPYFESSASTPWSHPSKYWRSENPSKKSIHIRENTSRLLLYLCTCTFQCVPGWQCSATDLAPPVSWSGRSRSCGEHDSSPSVLTSSWLHQLLVPLTVLFFPGGPDFCPFHALICKDKRFEQKVAREQVSFRDKGQDTWMYL